MKCNLCGNDFKIYDIYCGMCGAERENVKYGPLEEDERKFGIHSECYSNRGYDSIILGNISSVATRFTSFESNIYGKYKDALVKITSDGAFTMTRFEKAELVDEYVNAIFATDAGIFVRSADNEFNLYDFDGSWLYGVCLNQFGMELKNAYIYGDTIYALYSYSEIDRSNENFEIIAFCCGNDTQKVIWRFEEKNDLLEYFGLIEVKNRANETSYNEEAIPDVITRESFNHVYVEPKKFAVNSRRIVLELSFECESDFTYGLRTILLSIDKNTGESNIILNLSSREDGILKNKEIAFMDMGKELIWLADESRLKFEQFSFDDNFSETTMVSPSNVFENEGFRRTLGEYYDGEDYFGVESYNIVAAGQDGTVINWESHGYGDSTSMIVLGDVIYEKHGAFTNSSASDWNFYKKQSEMERVICITQEQLESEYSLLVDGPKEQEETKTVAAIEAEEENTGISAMEAEEITDAKEVANTDEPKKVARFCINCGEATVPGAKFCAFCGTKIMD